ncbi:MAG: polyphosphate polymerase domain-containing protein [Clostridia bacterium]
MNEKYRHELKYMINQPERMLLRARFAGVLRRDANTGPSGVYWIRSLYFDDYWNTAYVDKEDGVLARHKYRIRVYNCSDRLIRLERKNKVGQYINKQSAPLTREQTERILAGDYAFLEKSAHPLLQEFYYECTARIMRPRVIVDYDREPFVLPQGDVRITFDQHVRAGMGAFDLFDDALPTVEVVPANQVIMEIKFTEFLPSLVRSLLPPRSAELVAASKYVLCCDACVRTNFTDRVEGLTWKVR